MGGTIMADVGDGENGRRRLTALLQASHTGPFGRELAELKDPMTAALLYAQTCVLWLGGDTPNLREASKAAAGVVKALKRAKDIIDRSRSASRTPPGQALPGTC